MTLLCDRPVGDKGQRYEVRANGYPAPGFQPIGWSEFKDRAEAMARAIRKAPSCKSTEVWDRHDDVPVFKSDD